VLLQPEAMQAYLSGTRPNAQVDGTSRVFRTAILLAARGCFDDAAVELRKHDPLFMFHAQQCSKNIRIECRGVAVGGFVG
jgi:hypothetical protein